MSILAWEKIPVVFDHLIQFNWNDKWVSVRVGSDETDDGIRDTTRWFWWVEIKGEEPISDERPYTTAEDAKREVRKYLKQKGMLSTQTYAIMFNPDWPNSAEFVQLGDLTSDKDEAIRRLHDAVVAKYTFKIRDHGHQIDPAFFGCLTVGGHCGLNLGHLDHLGLDIREE